MPIPRVLGKTLCTTVMRTSRGADACRIVIHASPKLSHAGHTVDPWSRGTTLTLSSIPQRAGLYSKSLCSNALCKGAVDGELGQWQIVIGSSGDCEEPLSSEGTTSHDADAHRIRQVHIVPRARLRGANLRQTIHDYSLFYLFDARAVWKAVLQARARQTRAQITR